MRCKKVEHLCALLIFLLNFLILSTAEILEIEDGKLDGIVMTTRKNVNFHAFLKIPFAKPPLKELRFKPPVPNEKWEDVRNAKEFGPMCMQLKNHHNLSEDCLHLNVFTKNLGPTTLKPVIVFIHGGSFEEGSAYNHRPLYLMDRDIVLVTINYRLGAFGFLSSGTEEAIGNMGLKDQVLALKWIQKNIAKFGGDPTRVTIAGLSAGGFSVTAHMASEMSKGLFSKVISMSGAITSFGKMQDNNLHLVRYIAEKINCTASNTTSMMSCLQQAPAESIAQVDIKYGLDCIYAMAWVPVIEKDFGQDRFFDRHPFETFKNPEIASKYPTLLGITDHEMFYILPYFMRDEPFLARLKENFNKISAECFYLEKYSNESTLFQDIYLPHGVIDNRSSNNLGNLFGDGSISYGVHRLVQMISPFTDVYYYKFSYVGRYSVFKYPRGSPYGVSHADDLQYVFNTWYIGPDFDLTDPENFMVERMTRIWEKFAMNGDPNSPSDPYLADMIWPKYDLRDEYYLDIGPHLVEKQGLFLERFKAFDDLINHNSSRKVIKDLNISLLLSLIFIVTRFI